MQVTKIVFIGPDYIEATAHHNITPKMVAQVAMPFGGNAYGKKKVPTSWVVTYMGRVRRIYSDVIGNAGTAYVLVAGKKHFVRG